MKKYLVVALITSALNSNPVLRERIAQLIFIRVAGPNFDIEQCTKAANLSRFIRDIHPETRDAKMLSSEYPEEFEIVKKIRKLIARSKEVTETEEIKKEIIKL